MLAKDNSAHPLDQFKVRSAGIQLHYPTRLQDRTTAAENPTMDCENPRNTGRQDRTQPANERDAGGDGAGDL